MNASENDRLPFGLRAGINGNMLQPGFRDGPARTPRRLWPIGASIVLALLGLGSLLVLALLR